METKYEVKKRQRSFIRLGNGHSMARSRSAGWIVVSGYFVGNLIFGHYHDGQSITKYYMDN